MRTCVPALSCALLALLIAGCGGSSPARRTSAPPNRGTTPRPRGPALGLTEDNANLLASESVPVPAAFDTARAQLSALHPAYIRLLIDWAALQPSPAQPPLLDARVDGCARSVAPCGAYGGVRAEFAAIASQQRRDAAGFHVVLDVFGVPAWAAADAHGCEPTDAAPFARALRPGALSAYQKLIASLLALGREQGVALEWWSPWNEPNDPRFLSPQRERCSSAAPPVSAAVYAELARAMSQQLARSGGRHELVLGELQGLTVDSPRTTSIAQFVRAIPEDVACMSSVWSVHAYADYPSTATAPEPVQALEQALDARGGCGAQAHVWITEAGAGAPHAGQPRPLGPAAERGACEALARQLQRWAGDPRIEAAFQYSFREDPDFEVGLVSANLAHVYSTYRLLLAYSADRERGVAVAQAQACSE